MYFFLTKIIVILELVWSTQAILYDGDPCTIKSAPGTCTHQDQCPQLRQAFMVGAIRNEEIPRCGFAFDKEIICCPFANSSIFSQTKFTGRATESAAIEFCRDLENLSLNELEFHVVNGLPVKKSEYRFMASIGSKIVNGNEDYLQFHCGGTLISERFVLTAAHCVSDYRVPTNVVLLGSVSLSEALERETLIDVKMLHIHADFRPGSTYNDIALIELAVAVKFTNNIYPICLYDDKADPPMKSKVFVAGWGRTEKSPQSNSLLKAQLSIVPVEKCKQELGQLNRLMPSRRLAHGVLNTQICAKGQETDACEGDSGGPLILQTDDDEMLLIGITVAGFDCVGSVPGLYTRVASYLSFIEEIVWPEKKTNRSELKKN